MRKLVAFVVATTIASPACVALAAGIGLSAPRLGAGNAAIARCDTDGFTVATTVSGGNVTAVTIGDIVDPACEGATLHVVLTGSSGGSIATGGPRTVATDSGTTPNNEAVSVSPAPAESSVTGVQISMTGP